MTTGALIVLTHALIAMMGAVAGLAFCLGIKSAQ